MTLRVSRASRRTRPKLKWLALFAAGWFLQGYCNGYYLLFFSVFVGLWVLWFAKPVAPAATVSGHRRRVAGGGDSGAADAVALSRHSTRRSDFARDFGTIRDFGADVASLLHAADHIALWGWVEVFRPSGRGACSRVSR
jgi:hypothetical protein